MSSHLRGTNATARFPRVDAVAPAVSLSCELMVGDVADRCCKVGKDEEMFVVSVRVSVLSNGVAPSHPLTKSDVDLFTSCFT